MDSTADVKHYAWPSTVNVANFLTVKLSNEVEEDERIDIFKSWKEQMLCLLESQDVLGFVDGEILQPPEDNADDQKKQWRRTDRLVKGWILGSIEKQVLALVREKPTARDVWLQLDDIFDQGEAEINKEKEESEEGGEIKEEDHQKGGESEEGEESEEEDHQEGGEIEEEDHQEGGESEEEDHQEAEESKDLSSIHLAIYKAAQRGDWDTAHNLFLANNLKISARISDRSETALHVAVYTGTDKANDFVKKMVELMPRKALAYRDSFGDTALHRAAMVGNTAAAIAMDIGTNQELLCIRNNNNRLAVLEAAVFCHKEILKYLISKSSPNGKDNTFEGLLGIHLLNGIISSEFYDVALDVVHEYPKLAELAETDLNSTALSTLAKITYAFRSRESFSWWQRLIYYCIYIQKSECEADQATNANGDIENNQAPRNCSNLFERVISEVKHKLESVVWKILHAVTVLGSILVPPVRAIRNKKAAHQQALELVKYLCQQILTLPEKDASNMLQTSMMAAAGSGISEVVEVIMEMYPKITFYVDEVTGENIFHKAASHRFENVFNLIYNMSNRKHLLYSDVDYRDNNLMHICGKLAPPHKLNLVPGAALQLQRELQWFKEMENFVHPSRRTWTNINKQTPKMIFTNEHKQLKTEGERWMKDTANACTIAAALIATVMFTAAFTLPGGLAENTGVPIFVEQPSFILFAISDAVSLFTSITSLLMFLSILTSRYAEEDFLYVLPKRLSIGLFSLFISITFMLVAFSATMYLVFRGRVPWFLLPAAALTCLPVASFVLLQFPLLVDVVYSTYGPGIFGRKTDCVFH